MTVREYKELMKQISDLDQEEHDDVHSGATVVRLDQVKELMLEWLDDETNTKE